MQVAHDARLAEGVEALDDGGGVDEVAGAQHAHQVGVELRQLHPPEGTHHDGRKELSPRPLTSTPSPEPTPTRPALGPASMMVSRRSGPALSDVACWRGAAPM